MYKKISLLVLTSLFWAAFTQAQHNHQWCGTVGEDAQIIQERLRENKQALYNQPVVMRNIRYIPVKFHLIAKADGSDMVAKHRVLEQLCMLNAHFEEMGLQFYIYNGFNYIYNNTAYSNHSATQNTIMAFNRSNAAINIFVPENASPGTPTGEGTVLGYYSPVRDWLVIAKGEIGKSGLTFTHEVGHFFSLNHPFLGWDADPWNEATHGNPVMSIFAPNNLNRVELVDGSNCEIAGDEVCDTPADYLFGFGWDNCNFNLQVRDRNNEVLDPDELLWMNYFFSCNFSDYYFSPMQQALIIQDYNSLRRTYIRRNHVPTLTEITERPEHISPGAGEQLGFFNDVNLEWTPVEGAEAYLLQVSQVGTFSPALTVFDEVVYGTSKVISNLLANRNYFWRVRPFSAYRTCTQFSPVTSFRTGTLVSSSEEQWAESFSVFPNPASDKQELTVSIQSEAKLEANVRLFSIAGQEVRQYGRYGILAGDNNFSLPLQGLSPGVYLLRINTEKGQLSRKVIITR